MSGLYIAVVLENFELNDEYIRHYQIKDFIHRHRYKNKDRTEEILLKLFRPIYYFNESKSVQISKLPTNLTAALTKSDLNELLTDLPRVKKSTELKQPSLLERKLTVFFANVRQRIPFLKKKTSMKSAPMYVHKTTTSFIFYLLLLLAILLYRILKKRLMIMKRLLQKKTVKLNERIHLLSILCLFSRTVVVSDTIVKS